MDKIEKVSVNGQVYELAGSGGASAPTSITYSELKALVESSVLQAGARYRITDYVTSFKTWESAGHPFDIVVTALDAGTLLAEAVAMPHEEDEYFANNDLTAWKLFYEQGYDNTTVEELIEKSQTSKGSFYHYFEGKDALLGSLSILFDEKYQELMEKMDDNMNCFEKLMYLNRELFKMIENGIAIDLMARLYSSQLITKGEKHLLDHNRIYFRVLRQIVIQGQQKNEIKTDMPVNEIVKIYAMPIITLSILLFS